MEKDIKVGDMVYFYVAGEKGRKLGQVVSIDGENATVFVDKDIKAYTVLVESLKKA